MTNQLKKKVLKWVEKVLENRNFEKIHVEFPDFDTRGGHSGEMTFIDVHTEKNGKSEIFHMIVKKNKDGDAALDSLDLRLAYENEVELYSKLVPVFEKFAKEKNTEIFEDLPHCYGTIKERDRYVIIMENLKNQGYKIHQIKNPMDLKHAKLVLAAYGKWHAFSLALKDQKRDEIFKDFEEGTQKFLNSKLLKLFERTIQNEFDFLINIYKEKNKLSIIPKLEKLKQNYFDFYTEIVAPKTDKYLVIRHGDCWNNNYLFHYAGDNNIPDKVAIIDWQIGFLGAPLADVAQFLFNSCSRTELEHLDELLEFYYKNLSQKLRELGSDPSVCFPWEVCLKTFRKYAPVGITGCPMNAKMSNKDQTEETNEIQDLQEDGNFSHIFGKLGNPEAYFERVNSVLEFSIEHKLI